MAERHAILPLCLQPAAEYEPVARLSRLDVVREAKGPVSAPPRASPGRDRQASVRSHCFAQPSIIQRLLTREIILHSPFGCWHNSYTPEPSLPLAWFTMRVLRQVRPSTVLLSS